MEHSSQSMKTTHQAREADELRNDMRRKSLLVLIYHHLLEQGYVETAVALDHETNGTMRRFEVCDNVDLEMVLMEYESYQFVKFQKYPKLIRRTAEPDESRKISSGLKRTTCSAFKSLPKINPSSVPKSANTAKKTSTSGHPKDVTFSEVGIKISSIRIGPGAETPVNRKVTDAVKGAGLDSDHVVRTLKSDVSKTLRKEKAGLNASQIYNAVMVPDFHQFQERLLKPLSGFPGMSDEMRELAAVITRDIYVHCPNVRWEDIIGLEDAKRLVKEAVVYPIKSPQLFTGILSPWKALLLYGPPGAGKTLLAKAVATECKTTFFNISASSIVSKWRGDSEKLVRVLFELARYHAPSTIFLDELDSVMGQRGSSSVSEHEGSRRMKAELLVQMDGLARSQDLVFVLAASNLPWELDHAMLRRLEKRILVSLPCSPARQAMISHWLPPLSSFGGAELRTALDCKMLAEQTEGYSGSDIRLLCKEAAMRPVRKALDVLESHQDEDADMSHVQLGTVTTADFLDVIAHTKPSARNLMDGYAAWEREYGSV